MDDSVNLTLSQMFYDINRILCEVYHGLDPIKLLNYPAEDVFDLINGVIDYSNRSKTPKTKPDKIRRPAGDNWF